MSTFVFRLFNVQVYWNSTQVQCILCGRNATLYNPSENVVHQAAQRLTSKFRSLVEQFKLNQINKAQKSFANASSKPNSAVAALIDERNRKKFLESLVPSSGTLIVVPGVLMEHWQVMGVVGSHN